MISEVSIQRCKNYEFDKVKEVIEKSLKEIKAFDLFKKNQRVLLKTNLVAPRTNEQAINTHPFVVKAMVQIIKEKGAIPIVGDMSGFIRNCCTDYVSEYIGLKKILDKEKVEFTNFRKKGFRKVDILDAKYLKKAYIAKDVLDADVVISLPKAKTHFQMGISGAIKNFVGVMAPRTRWEMHSLVKTDKISDCILDIVSKIKPCLAIMDGIIGLEGYGPTEGTPRNLGYIISSKDLIATDYVTAYMMGLNADTIPTCNYGKQRELGNNNFNDIKIFGEKYLKKRIFFKKPPKGYRHLPYPLVRFVDALIQVKPEINYKLCDNCEDCVKACPQNALFIKNNKLTKNKSLCVYCYHCAKSCNKNAIYIKESILAKKLRKGEEKKWGVNIRCNLKIK